MQKKTKLSYTKFVRDIKDSAKEIQESYEFDYIVGLSRGGIVPAVHLSHLMNKPMTTLNFSTRESMHPTGNVISYSIMSDLNMGKKILIVDDIVDSGLTLYKLFKEWAARNTDLRGVKIFSVHYDKDNLKQIKSDFYMYEKKAGHWIVYPWEES